MQPLHQCSLQARLDQQDKLDPGLLCGLVVREAGGRAGRDEWLDTARPPRLPAARSLSCAARQLARKLHLHGGRRRTTAQSPHFSRRTKTLIGTAGSRRMQLHSFKVDTPANSFSRKSLSFLLHEHLWTNDFDHLPALVVSCSDTGAGAGRSSRCIVCLRGNSAESFPKLSV